MKRARRFGLAPLLLALGCASNTQSPSSVADGESAAAKTDAELVFAQEAGDLPAPKGSCPERTTAGVLKDPRAAVSRTAFGLAYCVLQEKAGGKVPAPTETVKVHYSGWTEEGRLFDSSLERGAPTELPLNQVIRGWTEMLQLMTPGDKVRVWIPGDMAYGHRGPEDKATDNPPKGTLVFEIELLEVMQQG